MMVTPHHPIPVDELARRICRAYHPFLHTVATVPCGPHLQAARNVYGLVTEDGTGTFVEVAKARDEAGLSGWGGDEDSINHYFDLHPEDTGAAVAIDETTDIEGATA